MQSCLRMRIFKFMPINKLISKEANYMYYNSSKYQQNLIGYTYEKMD